MCEKRYGTNFGGPDNSRHRVHRRFTASHHIFTPHISLLRLLSSLVILALDYLAFIMGDVERGEGSPLKADLTPRPWQHATYHSIASVLGVAGIAALPYSMAYLGWAGGLILLATATATSFYSGQCLIDCQTRRGMRPTRTSPMT